MELHSYFRMALLSCILGALFILTGCSQATVQPPLSTDVADAKGFKMLSVSQSRYHRRYIFLHRDKCLI